MKNKKVSKPHGTSVLEIIVAIVVITAIIAILVIATWGWKKATDRRQSLQTNFFIRETADEKVRLVETKNRDGSWKLTAYFIGPDTSIQIIGTDHNWSEANKVDGVPTPTFESLSLTIGRSDQVYLLEKQIEYGPHGIPRTTKLDVDQFPATTTNNVTETNPPVDVLGMFEEYESHLTKAVALTYRSEYLQEK
jgi:type II secretory pathway pseudopilin PulG